MEASGPRVPLDEASRIICELVDSWSDDPKSIIAMSMARPQMGNYDAFHQANTALLSVALGGAIGLPRAILFEVGLAGLLHQVGIVDMPDRIRYNRVLQKEEREILAQLPHRTIRRLLQAHGPDLNTMARLNAILAMKDPVAQKQIDKEGKARLLPINPKPPLMARILSVTSRYDALTSDREFRAAMEPKKAITLMLRQPLTLDSSLVRLLAKMQNVGG
jgi:HD-GYP domain-containing protein (c-di-GMP phosphodiesterase class II)